MISSKDEMEMALSALGSWEVLRDKALKDLERANAMIRQTKSVIERLEQEEAQARGLQEDQTQA